MSGRARRRLRLARTNWKPLTAALLTVVAVRLLLWTGGLPWAERFVSRVGSLKPSPAGEGSIHPLHFPRIVAWSVSKVAAWVPGASCLTQALAGQALLARHDVRSKIVVGVRPDGSALAAHAWLVHGDLVILGGELSRETHRTIREIELHAHA